MYVTERALLLEWSAPNAHLPPAPTRPAPQRSYLLCQPQMDAKSFQSGTRKRQNNTAQTTQGHLGSITMIYYPLSHCNIQIRQLFIFKSCEDQFFTKGKGICIRLHIYLTPSVVMGQTSPPHFNYLGTAFSGFTHS